MAFSAAVTGAVTGAGRRPPFPRGTAPIAQRSTNACGSSVTTR